MSHRDPEFEDQSGTESEGEENVEVEETNVKEIEEESVYVMPAKPASPAVQPSSPPVQPSSSSGPSVVAATPSQLSTKPCACSILAEHPLYPEVADIFYWRDLVRSGLVFGIGNFFYFLVSSGGYSVLTLVSYLLLSLLVVCFFYAHGSLAFAMWKGAKPENPLNRYKSSDLHISPSYLEADSVWFGKFTNALIDEALDIFRCSDIALSLKYAFTFWIASVIGKWFSGLTVLYLGFLVLFMWPRLYEEKQAEIDQACDLVSTKVSEQLDVLVARVPQLERFLKRKVE